MAPETRDLHPPDSTPPGDDPVRILLVDDQPGNLEALSVMLEDRPYELVRAHSADEALLALLEHDFAAIVLDIRMPGMSGIELAALIKKRKRSRHVPILFLTAHLLDEGDILQGYSIGAVDYLTKPLNPTILRSKLDVFADLYRTTRALARANEALEREIFQRRLAQEALAASNRTLEERVAERTGELLAAIEELRATEDVLRESDRRKDEFLATLAHELRNPLAPIRTAAEVLRRKGVTTARRKGARDVIERQVGHMNRLLDDLLDVSRITRDVITLRREPVEIGQVLSDAIEASRPAIEARGHRLEVCLPSTRAIVRGDDTRLTQIFSNLLNNAAQYTDGPGEIRLTAAIENDGLVVSVTDTGIGITPSMLPRIFDLFMQVDRSRGLAGMGIGLTLVRRLVELHDGSVEARSEGPGRGSEFTVRLPVQRIVPGERTDRPARLSSLPESPPRRILVVDDNHDAAMMLAVMLEICGHEVRMVHDGAEALRAVEDFRPAVVLLDIGLPDADGYTVARRIRQHEREGRALLVAVTGWGQPSDREKSRMAGFDHHLVKPVKPDELIALIGKAALPETPQDLPEPRRLGNGLRADTG